MNNGNRNNDQYNDIYDSGRNGINGINGINGLNGNNGVFGKNGGPGAPGIPGDPGAPGTPGGPNVPNAPNAPGKQKQTLSDIARGIQHAINTAQEILEQHYISLLGRYFDKGNNPKMVRIMVPPDTVMEVPLIALVTPSGMHMDELVLDLSLRVDETSVKKIPRRDGRIIERTSFAISVGGAKKEDGKPRDINQIDIRMVFKKSDPPEGVARIVDEFTKKIIPQKIVPKPQTEQDKWKL